jgi:hypothetical protein
VRAYPITVLGGGINRLRVKGGAAANQLYDLQNAYITNAGSVGPREGTIRAATLDGSTVGLAAANGTFNIFSSQFSTASLPANYVLNVLSDPNNTSASPVTIWYAKPFMGFLYVVAQFSDNSIFHYWLQNDGTWTSSTDYTSASIVLPPVANGLAYQGLRDFPPQPLWTPDTVITSASYIEPNTPTGFCYQAIAVAGNPVHTGQVEPVWPTVAGATIQEFGDFDVSSTDAGTTQATASAYSTASPLGGTITDRYGDSATIANAGIFATSNTLSTLTLASTKVTTWKAGTNYAPGAVVIPTSNQGAFVNAIPNGDFEGGSGAGGWTFTDPGGGAAAWAYSSTLPYQGTECITIPGGTTMGPQGAFATMTSYSLVTPGQSVTATAYLDPNNSGANLTLWLQLNWYNSADSIISSSGYQQNEQEGGGYRKTTVTGTAPTGAAHCRVSIGAGAGTTSRNAGFADLVSWNLESAAPITNFLFEAVQPAAGSSAAQEPAWPTVLGNEVIDGGVTWQAIGTSIITWQTIPLMQSGLVAPTFPTVIGNTVHDYSTYSNQNGYITTFCSMSWQCTDRHVIDTNNPQSIPVALGASHVFAGDNDIAKYSAAVNPTDWTSTNNAGYLPTGLNNYGDNPVAVLALYRSNLMVFNAGGYQMWQIDPDPQNMALLDAQPVGSIYPRAAQSVANDLLFLTEVGVRNLGTVGPTANMAVGNTGQPVDPLIQAQITGVPTAAAPEPVPIGRGDSFFSNVSLFMHFDSANGSTTFIDSSLNGFATTPVDNSGAGPQIDTSAPAFGTGALQFSSAGANVNQVTVPITAGGPLDMQGGSFTVEGWAKYDPSDTGGMLVNCGTPAGVPNGFEITTTISGGSVTLGGELIFTDGSSVNLNGPTATIAAGTWYAWALVRNGTSVNLFLNGTEGILNTIPAKALRVGLTFNIGGQFGLGNSPRGPGGELDELRVTKGIARYTSSFTPQGPLPGLPQPFLPLSVYYPGRGQYWLFFGAQAFVLTINGTSGTKSWSRYIFPAVITDATLNEGFLYLRTATNLVWQINVQAIGVDDSNSVIASATPMPFNGVMQWPYLDLGSLGRNKMMVGIDLVGDGQCSVQVAYQQADASTFNDNPLFSTSTNVTPPYTVNVDDTVPGQPLAFPINAPSYSVILTFPGNVTTANAWTWEAANLYITDAGGGGGYG